MNKLIFSISFIAFFSIFFAYPSLLIPKQVKDIADFQGYALVTTEENIYMISPSFSVSSSQPLNITGRPFIKGQEIYVPTKEGVSLLGQNLEIRSSVSMNGTVATFIIGDNLYIISKSKLSKYSYNYATLSFFLLKNISLPEPTEKASFKAIKDTLYVLTDSQMHVISLQDFSIAKSYQANPHFHSPANLMEMDSKAFFGDVYGNLYSVSPEAMKRELYLENFIYSGDSYSNEIYYSTSSGQVGRYDGARSYNYILPESYFSGIYRTGTNVIAVARSNIYSLSPMMKPFSEKKLDGDIIASGIVGKNLLVFVMPGRLLQIPLSDLSKGCYIVMPKNNGIIGYMDFPFTGYSTGDVETRINNGAWTKVSEEKDGFILINDEEEKEILTWIQYIDPNKLAFGKSTFDCRALGEKELFSSKVYNRKEDQPKGIFVLNNPKKIKKSQPIFIDVRDQYNQTVRNFNIIVDGNPMQASGNLTLELGEGIHTIILEKAGFETYISTIEVEGFPYLFVIGAVAILVGGVAVYFLVIKK